MPLNDKQRAFCEQYLVDHNATKAAVRAGYSQRSAYSIGNRLLKKDEINQLLSELRKERSEQIEVTEDWIIDKLVENINRAMKAEPVFDREGNPTGEYTYQGSVANKALELLMRHKAMLIDRTESRNLNLNINAGRSELLKAIPHAQAILEGRVA